MPDMYSGSPRGMVDVTASPPLEVLRRGKDFDFRYNGPVECWGKILGGPVFGAYSWEQVLPATGGTWTPISYGLGSESSSSMSGNLAYEVNGNLAVPIGKIVWMRQGFLNPSSAGLEFLFSYCCTM